MNSNPVMYYTVGYRGFGSSGDYIEFTDFQLELGSVATDFEHRSYGEELALCQRYYQRGISNGALGVSVHSTQATFGFRLPVEMRSEPTVSLISGTTLSCDMTHVAGLLHGHPLTLDLNQNQGLLAMAQQTRTVH